jgi:nucleotide-binding universal stress UspA family protein
VDWKQTKSSVLVPFDFSNSAHGALRVARAFVARPDHVTVLHVIAASAPAGPGTSFVEFDEASVKSQAHRALREAVEKAGFPEFHAEVRAGKPPDVVTEYAREQDSELIIIPSHGRRGMERFFLGSVAERVVRLAPCPVLVLRAKDE